jgi:FMN-dependent NADH-azoreductase
MTQILFVTSSVRAEDSFSNQVATTVLNDLRKAHPDAGVVIRDLAKEPVPHIDGDFVEATRTPQGPTTDKQRALVARSDVLVDELKKADIIVIAAPMYNFSIPSTLKAWIDYICRPGQTFSYSDKGPEGLLKGKRAILILARGGIYSSGPMQSFEHQATYLHSVLNFLGITNVQSIELEGVAYGVEQAAKAVETGVARAHELAAAA